MERLDDRRRDGVPLAGAAEAVDSRGRRALSFSAGTGFAKRLRVAGERFARDLDEADAARPATRALESHLDHVEPMPMASKICAPKIAGEHADAHLAT